MSTTRLFSIVWKELIHVKRDRITLAMMVIIPTFQLLLYGYAINTEAKHLPTAVIDYSRSEQSRRLIDNFRNTQYFDIRFYPPHFKTLSDLIDSGSAKVGIIIPVDFEKNIKAGRSTQVQVIIDASDPMTSSSALSAAHAIGQLWSIDLLIMRIREGGNGIRSTLPSEEESKRLLPVNVEIRAWYNPDQLSANFMIPGICGIILMMTTMTYTAVAIVKEREQGTLEQLIVTPITKIELMLGKMLPYIFIGYMQFTIILLLGSWIFDVSVAGSILLLYALTFFFMLSSLGLGLWLSTISKTQAQAFQLSFFIFLPSILLSGFIFPREAMPWLAQMAGYLLPITYFLIILRGIILKGVGLYHLWIHTIALILLGIVIIFLSIVRFQKRLD